MGIGRVLNGVGRDGHVRRVVLEVGNRGHGVRVVTLHFLHRRPDLNVIYFSGNLVNVFRFNLNAFGITIFNTYSYFGYGNFNVPNISSRPRHGLRLFFFDGLIFFDRPSGHPLFRRVGYLLRRLEAIRRTVYHRIGCN